MPFLHWDTDRNRSRMAEVIQQAKDKRLARLREEEDQQRGRTGTSDLRPCLPRVQHTHPDYYKRRGSDADPVPETVEEILWQKIRESRNEDPKGLGARLKANRIFQGVEICEGRRLLPAHPLARLLADAAKLYEAMTAFQDRKTLETFLFADPPVHPRRTLDQAYFWKLRTTSRRDRDQVVYRYTKPKFHHKFQIREAREHQRGKGSAVGPEVQPKAREKVGGLGLHINKALGRTHTRDLAREGNIRRNHASCDRCEERLESMMGWEWTNHGQYEDKHGCDDCRDQIRKVARAVMVDQLWMWILDENTILTCFPRRYGIGKKDPSGVHHSIRRRLKDQTNPANHIRSVFDLGLIIIEQCFDTFFDRKKTNDKRPQIMDIFAESIGRVVCLDPLLTSQ